MTCISHKMRLSALSKSSSRGRKAPHSLAVPGVIPELGAVLIQDMGALFSGAGTPRPQPGRVWGCPICTSTSPEILLPGTARMSSCFGLGHQLGLGRAREGFILSPGQGSTSSCPGCSDEEAQRLPSHRSHLLLCVPFPDGFVSCQFRQSPLGSPVQGHRVLPVPQSPTSVPKSCHPHATCPTILQERLFHG